MRTASGWRGRIILGPRDFVDCEAETVEALLTQLEAKLAERSAATRSDRVNGIPTADEYLGALYRLQQRRALGEHIEKMLAALYNAPGRTLSAGELAQAAGWSSYEATNTHLGSFAKLVAVEIGYQPPGSVSDGTPTWTSTLAEDAPERSPEGHFRWKMRLEVAEALERWWNSRAGS